MYNYLAIGILLIFHIAFASTDLHDAVHAKVGSKVYFTSDFRDLQSAIYIRHCELKNVDPNFWKLVKIFFQDKQVNFKPSIEVLLDTQLSYKKTEFEVLVLVIKLIQILVDQQVSIQKSAMISIEEGCLKKGLVVNSKVNEWHSKLIFLDDLLVSKANIEKDENKKQVAIKSIFDSLDKQIKHEALVELK